MTKQDFESLTIKLLQHKYEYYVLFDTVISDHEYDKLEREWEKMGIELGIDMDNYPNWIGFDENHPLAGNIKK